MSNTKTPGQVAEFHRVFCDAYDNCPSPLLGDMIDAGIAAVLAHAAPKWRPVSELAPENGEYWVRCKNGKTFKMFAPKDYRFLTHIFSESPYTHWSGPIEPPPF